MADEPINIQVVDNVDPNIQTKLIGIADASDSGTSALARLKAALADLPSSGLDQLRKDAQSATQTINAELQALNASRQALDAMTASAANAAKAESDLTAKTQAATDALNRQADAAKKPINIVEPTPPTPGVVNRAGLASAAFENPEAVSSAAALSAATGTAKQAEADIGAAAAGVAASVGTAEKATEELATKGPGFFAKFKEAALTAFDGVRDFITGNGTRFLGSVADDAEKAAPALEKVTTSAHGSSTAIRELLVLAREGGRGDFTRMAGSASILANALGLLGVVLPVAAAGFVGLYAARKDFNTDAEQKSLTDYANSLGLTEKEMRKLSDTTVDANGKLHEHNDLQVTYGDTINGFLKTVQQGFAATFGSMTQATSAIKPYFDVIVSGVKYAFEGFYASVMTLISWFEVTVNNMATIIGNASLLVFNGVTLAIQGLTNKAIDGINALGGNLQHVDLGVKSIGQGMQSLGTINIGDTFNRNLQTVDRTLTAFGQKWKQNTDDAARDRIKSAADAIIANRNPPKPKKEHDPKDKDDYLDDENKKLDDQIARFGMLKDARDAQQQLNEVEEAFAKRRMPLNDAEIAQFKAKIDLIQQNNKVQTDMDKIYNDINGPLQAYNVAQSALNELLSRGYITQVQYQQQLDKATRTYQQATDPLFQMNEQLKQQAQLLGLAGDALTHQSNYQQVYNAFLAKGIDLTKNATAADKARAAQMVKDLDAQNDKKYVSDTVKGVVDPMIADKKYLASKKDFYDQIAQMEQNGVITHQTAEQAKAAIDAKYNQIRLSGAQTFFEDLSGLTASKNKELAAIGKAAAVINATIKGYEAVQNALAEVPYPFNIAAAAAVAVTTGVQVANIISTPTDVGSYWTGGDFIVRGQTGVDTNRIAMNVTDGERVTVQTVAQQNEAKKNSNGAAPAGDTHVNNFFDEASFVAAMDSQAGEKVVMNIISRNPKQVKGMLK